MVSNWPSNTLFCLIRQSVFAQERTIENRELSMSINRRSSSTSNRMNWLVLQSARTRLRQTHLMSAQLGWAATSGDDLNSGIRLADSFGVFNSVKMP